MALVVPTLREAENLSLTLPRIQAALAPLDIACEILIVDDDSRDGTEEIVSAMARDDARIRLLVRRHQRGLAGAVLHGWRQTDASILGVLDADGQHPPELLPQLLNAIQNGCELAIASRFVSGSRCSRFHPFRRLLSAAAILLTQPLQHPAVRVHDPLSGFFLVRRSCVEDAFFQPGGFKLLLEILAFGRVRHVGQVPFTFGERHAGRSKVGLAVAWDYVLLLARLYRLRFSPRQLAREPAEE